MLGSAVTQTASFRNGPPQGCPVVPFDSLGLGFLGLRISGPLYTPVSQKKLQLTLHVSGMCKSWDLKEGPKRRLDLDCGPLATLNTPPLEVFSPGWVEGLGFRV